MNVVVLVFVLVVAAVLIMGLLNMMKGGSPNKSQNLMRARVMLQFVAIVVIMLVLWWRTGTGPS